MTAFGLDHTLGAILSFQPNRTEAPKAAKLATAMPPPSNKFHPMACNVAILVYAVKDENDMRVMVVVVVIKKAYREARTETPHVLRRDSDMRHENEIRIRRPDAMMR
jgi:hypothetical protein